MAPEMKVMVAGATGYIGGSVVEGLHRQGFWIRALTRDPNRLQHPEWCDDVFVGHATQPQTLRGLCEGIDVVFSSIGVHSFVRKPTIWEVDYQANINILEAARLAGVKHFIFISTVRAPEMARTCPIAAAREAVAHAIVESGMDYTIFRPAAFFNDMQHVFDAAARRGVVYLPGNPEVRMNPLHGLDFADEVARAITDPALRNVVTTIGGPEVLTRRQIAELAFAALGQPANIRRVPLWIFSIAASLARPFHYNFYAIVKFLTFALSTEDMTAEPVGHRRVADLFEELAQAERSQSKVLQHMLRP